MSIKILTKNSIDNTNIDGARQNHFSAGMRSGIVKGAFNEGKFFTTASNIIALDTCELRISGHQVIIDSLEAITLSDRPSTPTKYSMIAEIQVSDMSVPSFRLFIQPASVGLRQENLFKTNNGSGTYQLRIGNFTLGTTGLISDVIRTADLITGGGEGGVADIKFNATATQLSSSSQPEVNIDFNEETKEYDMHLGIPAGSGSRVTIGGVEQPSWSADFVESEKEKSGENNSNPIIHNDDAPVVFAESERQKSKNLWAYGDVSGTRWKDTYLTQPLPAGTYTFSAVATNTDTSSNYALVEFYDASDKWIKGAEILKNERASFTVTLSRDCYRITCIGTPQATQGIDFTFVDIMLTTDGSTDYQPYNGAIVRDKQLKEAVEKMGLLYQNNTKAIQIQNSSLTTLSDYFNLFNLDKTKVYKCYKEYNQTTKFSDLLNLPSSIANGALFILIKLEVDGQENTTNYYTVYKITIFDGAHGTCHIGYMGKGYDNVVRVIGWTKIGG